MSVSPVGDGHVDAKPWRRGPLVKAITDRAASISALPKPKLPARMQGFPYRAPAMPGNAEPLDVASELGVNYQTEWARGPGARVTRRVIQAGLLSPALRALTVPDIRGLDRIEALNGPVIFVANHHSHLDTGLLLTSLPYRFRKRAIVAAAADYFFDKRFKATVSALVLNAVPIERRKVSRDSSDQLLALLRRDWSLIIFPEGGRSSDGWGQEFKPGAAFLAIRRVCPIVPVHIEGTDEVLPKGKSIPKRHKTIVTFGDPIMVTDDDNARELTVRIEAAVTLLGDEQRSDWWTARRLAASGTSTSLSGPTGVVGWRRQWDRTTAKAAKEIKSEQGDRIWP